MRLRPLRCVLTAANVMTVGDTGVGSSMCNVAEPMLLEIIRKNESLNYIYIYIYI
jgi:hypothetical protein